MNDRKNDTMTTHTLQQIAATLLGVETLDTRHSDSLDFHDLAVWQIEAALRAAYEAGAASEKSRKMSKK